MVLGRKLEFYYLSIISITKYIFVVVSESVWGHHFFPKIDQHCADLRSVFRERPS